MEAFNPNYSISAPPDSHALDATVLQAHYHYSQQLSPRPHTHYPTAYEQLASLTRQYVIGDVHQSGAGGAHGGLGVGMDTSMDKLVGNGGSTMMTMNEAIPYFRIQESIGPHIVDGTGGAMGAREYTTRPADCNGTE